ncbi:MAG: nitroreductase family deazaflavin-dependent oxidoreductase [Acidobacteriota bacterium]|nr:nitroreductase family deazaflavin-dependent oxidoreductase [Acidobacteriota bacterium]
MADDLGDHHPAHEAGPPHHHPLPAPRHRRQSSTGGPATERGCDVTTDWNRQIIDEFRANEGRVGGNFEGAPVLLLHTTGARTGTARVNPMMYQRLDGTTVAVFASKAGAPTNPDWYHNLLAHPEATAEIGTETIPVRARVAEGDERSRIWEKQKADYPGFADYERKTSRTIPVVILEER